MNVNEDDSDTTKVVTPKVQWVLKFIDLYFYQNLKLGFCASLVELHPDYFGRKFKREVGVPFHEYLLRCRLRRATILLAGC